MDRTKDFLRLTSEAVVVPRKPATPQPVNGHHNGTAVIDKKEKTKQVLYFNDRAGEVSKGIQACSVLLSRLTNLARAQTLFNDPSEEMANLSNRVKSEISTLKTKLTQLEDWLKINDLGSGKDAKLHSEQIVKNMEFKLHDSGKQFAKVLESRKNAIHAQSQRKKMFGADSDGEDDIGRPIPQSAFKVKFDHDDEEANPSGGNSLITSASIPFQQQNQLIPDTQYLRSRVDAMSTVETQIAELGKIMTNLASMIQDQDLLVRDIEENVDHANEDIRAGFVQLQKYYDSIRGNKSLLRKLFSVLVVFLLFFLFFLA